MDNIRRQNWVSAGMMLRKVLQPATTTLASDNGLGFQGVRLEPHIAKLADQHCITPAMREWADIVRVDGNVGTHTEDEEFPEEQAKQMATFTEIFLMYAFTLPQRVKEYEDKTQHIT